MSARAHNGDPARTSPLRQTSRFWPRLFAEHRRWLVLVTWLLACGAAVATGALERRIGGHIFGLLPQTHRPRTEEGYLLLELESSGAPDQLLAMAERAREELGSSWFPIAAPSAELSGWLDAHALHLLPPSTHDALEQRLSTSSIQASVDALKAQMSSPFFALATADARRDPLGLRALARGEKPYASGATPASASRADPSPAGDLLGRDGTSLLMAVHADRPIEQTAERIQNALGARARVSAVGLAVSSAVARERANSAFSSVGWTLLAGVTIVLAVSLRRVRPAAAIVTCLASGALLGAVFVALDPLSSPLTILALGFVVETCLPVNRLSKQDWLCTALLGLALAPLLASPFPLWRQWAPQWLAIICTLALTLRLVVPALLSALRFKAGTTRGGSVVRPMPTVSLLLGTGLLATGAWATPQLEFRGADRLDLGATRRVDTHMAENYFEPRLLATVASAGRNAPEALARAAGDARLLRSLVPMEARVVDTPGALVLQKHEIERRQARLAQLQLGQRLSELREVLEAHGFLPDAFGEFLRSASDPRRSPTPSAALDGPLGPWIRGYISSEGDTTVVKTRVHLGPDPDVVPPALLTPDGRLLTLRGPAIGGRVQANELDNWVAFFVLAQLWLTAFAVGVWTRSLPAAAAAALAGLGTQAGIAAAMVWLGISLSAASIPAVLLAGSTASIAAIRAGCTSATPTPRHAASLWVAIACPCVAGLALIASRIPLWSELGVITVVGALLASGAGLFVAPGLAQLFRGGPSSRPSEHT